MLQDVHWSAGLFGYFPTYQLGNVMSVQIWEAAQAALPGVEERFAEGEFGELGDWLRENLYALGRKLTPKETLERVVGWPDRSGAVPALPARQVRGRRLLRWSRLTPCVSVRPRCPVRPRGEPVDS